MMRQSELPTNKVIEATEDVSISEEDQASIRQLFRIGEEQGFITLDDIASYFPESEASLPVIERVYDTLLNAGIKILEDEEASEKKSDLAAEEAEAEKEDERTPAEVRATDAIDSGDSVGLYLSQVGRVPLLTRDEEVKLAKRIERGRRARNELARGPVPPRQRAKTERLIQKGMAAREYLIMANSRLVISVAKKYIGRGVPLLDLVQEGHVGLMRAVEKFDYRRGHKFSTYAHWWIRQAVTRLVADNGRTIRIPVHMVDRINRMMRSRHVLTQELGHEPGREELADCLGVSPHDVDYMLRVAQRPLSLEKPTGQDWGAVVGDFIEDQDSPTPEEIATQEILKEQVHELLEALPHREALVLRLRYGLEAGKAHTLRELGEKMGITRERVRQIEAQALGRLRNPDLQKELFDLVST
jgi:RNA polymerase primary sigma factor